MSIQITINGADALEVIQELSILAAHLTSPKSTDPVKAEKPARGSNKTANAAATETKKESDPALDQEETGNEDGDKGSTEDIPTVVDLRAKAQEVGTSAEAKKAIKALLDKFECKSISDVPEEKRADFLSELEGI